MQTQTSESKKAKSQDDEAKKKIAAKDQESDADETDADGDEGEETTSSDLGWTAEQKAVVESLRKENARYRTKAKDLESKLGGLNDRFSKLETGLKTALGGEDDKSTPEEKIAALTREKEQLHMANALKEAAWEYDVPKKDYEYFEFLVSKKLARLKDGEELSEEELGELAKEAKSKSAKSSSSVDDDPPKDKDKRTSDEDEVGLDEFKAMNISEKSLLYQKNKALYEKLYKQAMIKK